MGRVLGWPEAVLSAVAGEGAFIGILDGISNIAACYSASRRLRSAYTGNLIELRRSSDDATQAFGYDSDGELDTAAIATFLGAGSGYLRTLYDQSGNGRNLVQTADNNDQWLYVASGIGGKPTGQPAGAVSGDGILDAAFAAIAQPTHIMVVAQITLGGAQQNIIDTPTGNRQVIYRDNSDNWSIYAGAVLAGGAADENDHIISSHFNGANSELWVDGVSKNTGNAGTQTLNGLRAGNETEAAGNPTPYIVEIIVVSATISNADHNTIGNDQATRYGLSWTNVS